MRKELARFKSRHLHGATELPVLIITPDDLGGFDPLLYAAKKAIGPLQLNEQEVRDTACRA